MSGVWLISPQRKRQLRQILLCCITQFCIIPKYYSLCTVVQKKKLQSIQVFQESFLTTSEPSPFHLCVLSFPWELVYGVHKLSWQRIHQRNKSSVIQLVAISIKNSSPKLERPLCVSFHSIRNLGEARGAQMNSEQSH